MIFQLFALMLVIAKKVSGESKWHRVVDKYDINKMIEESRKVLACDELWRSDRKSYVRENFSLKVVSEAIIKTYKQLLD